MEKCKAHKTDFSSVATGGFCKKLKLQFTNLYIHSIFMSSISYFSFVTELLFLNLGFKVEQIFISSVNLN